MNKKDELKLDVLSQIEDGIIEEHTLKRIELLKVAKARQQKRRRWWAFGSAAACLALFFGIMIPILLLSKQVPIYKGMTVSNQASLQTAWIPTSHGAKDVAPNSVELLSMRNDSVELLNDKNNGNNSNGDKHEDKEKKPIEEVIESTLEIVGSGEKVYYATPNETIYITIHVSNPDSFEIQSFTLNGKKYSNYMFEDGSDMEHLILKCDVGNTEGMQEYTIDAIKYIDGESIKDVRMDGDKTVKVGVYTKTMPEIKVTAETPDFNSYTANVTLTDVSSGMFTLSGGKAYVLLYDGAEILKLQELKVGEKTTFRVDGLSTYTSYTLAVVGVYDANDGNGEGKHLLWSKTVTTKAILSIHQNKLSQHEITFSLTWGEGISGGTLKTLALYDGDTKVRDLPLDATQLTELLSDHTYRLQAEYENKGETETVSLEFTTRKNKTPKLEITDRVFAPTSFAFTPVITDPDQTGRITEIRLTPKDGGDPIVITDPTECRVDGLTVLQTYTVKVTYTYDLRDGSGTKTVTATSFAVTQSAGLKIQLADTVDGSYVEGIGTCTDTTLYLNLNVENESFRENYYIREVHCGSGVKIIGVNAFFDCASLQAVTFQEGLTSLGGENTGDQGAFSKTAITKIVLPNSLTKMYEGCFANCQQLTEVTLGTGLKQIPAWCFYNTAITEIVLPDTIRSIGNSAFLASKLEQITLSATLKEIGEFAFAETNLKEITIPEGVTSIGAHAFEKCERLEKVTLPTTLTKIDSMAFFGTKVTEISIPEGVTEIGSSAFAYCTWLQKVTLPNTLISIGTEAFVECMITEIVLPDSVVQLGSAAFYGCQNLKKVTLSQGLLSLPVGIFNGCVTLEEIVIPEGVILIDGGAFEGCSALKSVTLPSSLKKIGGNAFARTGIVEIQLPDSVTEIGDWAFQSCGQLTKINIPEGVTEIGTNMFAECRALHTITLPSTLKRIGESAFMKCESLTQLVLPAGLVEIGEGAFFGCKVTALFVPQSVQKIGAYALDFQVSATIRVEAAQKPALWHEDWCGAGHTVIWGYTNP